ncbi:MAG TPA: asparagine synthase (glutamine-hydrolyzing) [Thermoanaerobaculia bacterium]|nr:asparagine synthase (glutamine-hydrolyzing) [Thermoanaerobaculia bacterium]
MCGIVGWAGREPVEPSVLDRALESLNRRGPDGSGRWVSPGGFVSLGHRRLAILDTSIRGEEPSVAPDGRSAFIHNGEIYNFRELRRGLEAKGERFVSESDGEVAHRLLREEHQGAGGLTALEGMFALALWDGKPRRLLLARDRLGIKPLYYAVTSRGLAFASEPRALLEFPGISARCDPDALSDFLSYGYVPLDRSLFAGIRKLPPAHRLLFDPATGEAAISRYWALERRGTRDDREELRGRIDDAVRSHLVSDVPLGAFLSGGLDSTTVVARAAQERPSLPTFTLAYRDGDRSDLEFSRVAAGALGTRHREQIVEMEDLPHALAHAAEAYDEPLYDSSALAVASVAALAKREVKVVLTGDGGDEIFGGYGWDETVMRYEAMRGGFGPAGRGFLSGIHRFLASPLSSRPAAARLAGTARLLAPDFVDRYFPVRGFFSAAEQRRVLGRPVGDPAWLFRKFDRPDLPLAHRLLYLDLHTYLPDNGLMQVDRSTMAVGLEARVPLLDRQLVEYAFSLPPDRLLVPGRTKIAFREAIAPWIPEAILHRPKSGFSPPFKKWVGGENRKAAFRYLEAGDLAADGVIRPKEVRRLVARGTQRRNNKVWLLLNLEAWYRRWIRGKKVRSP